MSTAVAQTLVQAILLGFLYSTVAAGLSLQWGVTKIVNFAYGEFLMVGGYATYFAVTDFHLPLPAALVVAGACVGALALVVYAAFLVRVLESAEHNQLLATLGLSIVLLNGAVILWTPQTRALQVTSPIPSYSIAGLTFEGNRVFVAVVGLFLYLVLFAVVRKTRIGLLMRTAADDPSLAPLTGVNVRRTFGISFVTGSVFAGLAGGLVALILYIQPTVGQGFVLRAFAIIALGGLGSMPGAFVGAFVLALSEGLVSAFAPNGGSWGYGVAFLVLLLILIVRPSGLFGRKVSQG